MLAKFITIIFLAQAYAFAQNPTGFITDFFRFHYQSYACGTQDGVTCIAGIPETPIAGVATTITVTRRRGSGQHWHEQGTDQLPESQFVYYVDGKVKNTDAAGNVDFTIEFLGWAGTYDITMQGAPKNGFIFPTKAYALDVKVQTTNKAGAQVDLVRLKPGNYSFMAQGDYRHNEDPLSSSFWTTPACNAAITKAIYNYNQNFMNPNGYKLIPIRLGLKWGGKADNEADANFNYVFPSYWGGRQGEWHAGAISVDWVNFGYAAGGNPTNQNLQFSTALTELRRAGVYLSLKDGWGNTIGDYNAAQIFWFERDHVHTVCMLEPTLPM